MSLLTTASPWNSDNGNKRKSSLKKVIKNMTHIGDSSAPEDAVFSSVENFQATDEVPSSISGSIQANNDRSNRVQQLLNQMSVENDGNKLADFNPISRPQITQKKDIIEGRTGLDELKPEDLLPSHPANQLKMNIPSHRIGQFGPNDMTSGMLSNYSKSYEPAQISSRPYYAKMGIDSGMGIGSGVDSKLLEKINYMIHLLEEQQDEKTGHVTEEFMLYGFMGIFIIFVLDSFARAGKYVR
jgi:hypothetical protein